ncbi:serine/threonine-protein kinase ULK3 isoform 8-T8 [Alca torda]
MAGAGWAPPRLDGFILTERLGAGTYATVYKAYRKRDTREVVAIKCVSKRSLNRVSVENLLTEIEILKTIRHPHIVELKDFQWDSDHIYLIMEFCAGGDLSRFIRMRRILPEKVTRIFLQQLACALKFLHDHNISHLDLKPQNILLSAPENPQLKLADFGFAQHMSPWDEKHVLRGSPLYMAPEMVCRQQYDARVDLWSVGVILYDESDARRKEAIRVKVGQYISRAEELKAVVTSSSKNLLQQGNPAREILKEMAKDKPRLIAALEIASAAMTKEEEGKDDGDTLELYQQSLGDLLLLLAAEPVGRRRELLHAEVGASQGGWRHGRPRHGFERTFLSLRQIQTLMARAEYLKDQMKMRETQSRGKEALAEPIRSSESPSLSPLVPWEGVWQKGGLGKPPPLWFHSSSGEYPCGGGYPYGCQGCGGNSCPWVIRPHTPSCSLAWGDPGWVTLCAAQ